MFTVTMICAVGVAVVCFSVYLVLLCFVAWFAVLMVVGLIVVGCCLVVIMRLILIAAMCAVLVVWLCFVCCGFGICADSLVGTDFDCGVCMCLLLRFLLLICIV